MKPLFSLALLLSLAGCGAPSQTAAPLVPSSASTTSASAQTSVSLTPSQMEPAQGKIAPGVLVYDKNGDMQGRIIKVDSDWVFPDGTRGAVLINWNDANPQDLGHAAFHWVDNWFVKKD